MVLLTVGCCWLCDAVGCWLVRNLINSGTGCAGYILRLAHKGCTVGAQKARRGRAGGAQGARRGRAEGAQGARRGRAQDKGVHLHYTISTFSGMLAWMVQICVDLLGCMNVDTCIAV